MGCIIALWSRIRDMGKETRNYTPVLDDYLKDFGLRQRDLTGKRILDAGAGMRMFAAECGEEGVGKVWSLALETQDWLGTKQSMQQVERMNPGSEWLAIWRQVEERSQCGQLLNLPYAAESFDLVLSRYALVQVFDNEVDMERAMLEVIRILKHGGEARIFPGWTDNWPSEQKMVVWASLAIIQEVFGVEVEVKPVQIKLGGMRVGGALIVLRKE